MPGFMLVGEQNLTALGVGGETEGGIDDEKGEGESGGERGGGEGRKEMEFETVKV